MNKIKCPRCNAIGVVTPDPEMSKLMTGSFTGDTMTPEEGYAKFRGKCRQMSEDAAKADPALTVVRGHYWCPMWNRTEAHWWCTRPDGTIVDPTARQFPSAGMGDYTPFDDIVCCEQCGKTILEADSVQCGNYAVCSTECACRLVGV